MSQKFYVMHREVNLGPFPVPPRCLATFDTLEEARAWLRQEGYHDRRDIEQFYWIEEIRCYSP